jgi:xylulokinase
MPFRGSHECVPLLPPPRGARLGRRAVPPLSGTRMTPVVLGIDVGTSSTKGVIVDGDGRVIASTARAHAPQRPAPGHVEMDGRVWWDEFLSIAAELTAAVAEPVVAVGVSGMGPCALLTDEAGAPLRPAILYGVDSRATAEIADLEHRFGTREIHERSGSALSSQAVGPKLLWVARHEPEVALRARRLYMPASWFVWNLTGEYVLDRHSASQCTPLFDCHALDWYGPWCSAICPELELPRLLWSGEIAGVTRKRVAGIPAGTPVIAGTIDAWSEAVSVGAEEPGTLMLMYGTTMFLVATLAAPATSPTLWGTVGTRPDTWNLAGGMATSGAVTGWISDLANASFADLTGEAATSGPGARGLLMLPYFAGERTPISDPAARGVIVGLTVSHTRGDLYRAALEATAFGVRHNLEALLEAGVEPTRVVAVGGGTIGGLWARIVSDVTGIAQEVPAITVGAAYGSAFLAARATSEARIADWNPIADRVEPDPTTHRRYDERYAMYRELYPATRSISHRLARTQGDAA